MTDSICLPTLRTERLVLRQFRLSDAPDVQRLAGERAVADTTLNMPHPYPDGAAETWIAAHEGRFAAREACPLAITLAETGEVIGAIELMLDTRFDRAELGYWIGVPHWNRGYCTEAARALVEYGFTVLGLNRIHAAHFARNPASGRVMQKLGMTREGVARQHVKRWGKYEDLVCYGLLADEWRERSGRPA